MTTIDECVIYMWKVAKERGRTRPALGDFLDSVERYLPGNEVLLSLTPEKTILARIKHKGSPNIIVRLDGAVATTVGATPPSKFTPNYRGIMDGMDRDFE